MMTMRKIDIATIEAAIRANAGLVANAMMGTPEADAEASTPD